jgi:hypothetical protein
LMFPVKLPLVQVAYTVSRQVLVDKTETQVKIEDGLDCPYHDRRKPFPSCFISFLFQQWAGRGGRGASGFWIQYSVGLGAYKGQKGV